MISEVLLDKVAERVADHALEDDLAHTLRAQWPDVHFTYCQDDDIVAARPVRECETFNLYLVSNAQACISFTSHPDHATGIVIAEIESWEDE